MEGNVPDSAIGWVRRASWVLCEVPWDLVDDDDLSSWAAAHQPGAVGRDAREITEGGGGNPGVLIRQPGASRLDIVDGHHHALARHRLGRPVLAYVGDVRAEDVQAALETHSSQFHAGSSPANKAAKVSKESVNYRAATDSRHCGNCVMFRPDGTCDLVAGRIDPLDVCDRWETRDTAKSAGPPVAAGLAVRAADTGRVLMLQRAYDDDDPAGGYWEMPGGRLEPDEEALEAACREWSEETGLTCPEGDLTGIWSASNGRYRGFVLTIPSEDAVDILGPRDAVGNPDDEDGDLVEALAWFDPKQIRDNPSIRPELAEDHKRVRRALKSAGNAETLREYWTHEAHPGPTHFAYAD
jgi:8-oxo-dGTP pyrophosphatase MutT (NUDIX family)